MTSLLRASLIAYGVTLFFVTMPLLHVLTGIPGPFIGGVMGGIRIGSRSGNLMAPAGIGIFQGVLMALTTAIVGVLVFILLQLFGLLEDMKLEDLKLVPLAVGGYVMVLGTAGAFFGLVLSGRKNSDQPDASR